MHTTSVLRKKTESQLRTMLSASRSALESEKRYHAVVDNMMEGFQIIDYNWRYVYVNNTVVKHGKSKRQEMIGFTMMEKYPGIDNTPLFDVLRKCMRDRLPGYMENRFDYPDGSVGWFELRIQPVQEGLLILSLDITERKIREAERKAYLKGLEEIAFATSHQLRSPVVSLLGIADLLSHENTLTKHELAHMTESMRTSVESLDNYTRQLSNQLYHLKAKTKASATGSGD